MRWAGSARKVRLEAIAFMSLRLPLLSKASSMPNSFASSLTNISEWWILLVGRPPRPSQRRGRWLWSSRCGRRSPRWCGSVLWRGYDPARGHLEVGDQAPGTVANVLVLLKLAASFARLHRKGRMETLQSLDGGLLIGGDHMHALLIA